MKKFAMADTTITNTQMTKLKAFDVVEDVENEGMDEGRFFVHLKSNFEYPPPYYGQHTMSFGGYREAVRMIKKAIPA